MGEDSMRISALIVIALFSLDLQSQQTSAPPHPEDQAWGFHCGTGLDTDERAGALHRLAMERGAPHSRIAADQTRARPRVDRGVIVMETDPVTMLFDRPFDLAGKTVSLKRGIDGGYTAAVGTLEYDENVGLFFHQFEFSDDPDWHHRPYAIASFDFPFGSRRVSDIIISAHHRIDIEAPITAGFDQFHLLDALSLDRPTIAPLARTLRTPSRQKIPPQVFVKETAEAVTVTWRTPVSSYFSTDLQVRIDADGDLTFSYRVLKGDGWGALMVSTGEEPWRAFRETIAVINDASGDVRADYPEPLKEALDITSIELERIGNTGLIEARIRTRRPIVRTQITTPLAFELVLGDDPGVVRDRYAIQIGPHELTSIRSGGAIHSPGSPAVDVNGDTVTIRLLQEELLSHGSNLWIGLTSRDTGHRFNADAASGSLELRAPTVPSSVRFATMTSPATIDGPLVETFTLPAVNIQGVWQQLKEAYGLDPTTLDGVAVYQDHATDIIFYAGAYALRGNPGVDGISSTNGSALPRAPTLMHMNLFDYGWNARPDISGSVINHEFGHRWLYFFSIMEEGVRSQSLNPLRAHPAQYVHTAAAFQVEGMGDASTMGGSNFRINDDGTFTTPDEVGYFGYSWHELYLMGLAAPEEVEPWYYIADSDPPLGLQYSPPPRTTVSGTRRDVNIQQLIDAMGPRHPAATESQRQFRVLFVLLTRPGAEPLPGVTDKVVEHRLGFEKVFHRATGGRASVSTAFGSEPRRRAVTRP
jgi:hypothetical protein